MVAAGRCRGDDWLRGIARKAYSAYRRSDLLNLIVIVRAQDVDRVRLIPPPATPLAHCVPQTSDQSLTLTQPYDTCQQAIAGSSGGGGGMAPAGEPADPAAHPVVAGLNLGLRDGRREVGSGADVRQTVWSYRYSR